MKGGGGGRRWWWWWLLEVVSVQGDDSDGGVDSGKKAVFVTEIKF